MVTRSWRRKGGLAAGALSLLLGCAEERPDEAKFQQEKQGAALKSETEDEAVERGMSRVEAILAVANRVSDTAAQEYEDAVSRARIDGTASELREALETTAAEEYATREMMAIVLGSIGGDGEVPTLFTLAVEDPGLPGTISRGDAMDLSADDPVQEDENGKASNDAGHDGPIEFEERGVLRRGAVSSLGQIASRGSQVAKEALSKVVEEAPDKGIAQAAGLLLFEQGLLRKREKSVLKKRGIPHGFRVMTEAETIEVLTLSPGASELTQDPPEGE